MHNPTTQTIGQRSHVDLARGMKFFAALAISIASALAISTATADARTEPFGCSHEGRRIAATVFYSEANALTWSVSHIDYNYSNSGGGEANTNFTVNNGSGTPVFTWATPDDRHDGRDYTKSVDTLASKGNGARALQTTFFDTFGNDPHCSGSGNL